MTKKISKKFFIGALSIMLAALFWSLDGVFIRPKFYELPAGLIVFLEHFLGFIFLSPFIYINWAKIKMLRKKDWVAILWVCIFGGLLGTLMITKAFFAAIFGEVTFATVVILQKLQPIFALVLARIIIGEKLAKKFYIWAIIAIASGYFLAFGKTGLNIFEIDLFHNAAWFAILAAFAFGSSTVFGKRVLNHLDFKSATALRFGITSLLALILIFITGDIFKIGDLSNIHWGLLFVIVFTSGAAALFIYYFGLKRVTASVATICELFWPLSAVVLDYFINKNTLNYIQIIASIVLLISFYMVVSSGKRKKPVLSANVVSGEGRGERLGYPTINLNNIDIDIDHGVYFVKAVIDEKEYDGLLHFGPKETFNESSSSELFVKEKILGIKQKNVIIKIIKKIRDIKKYNNSEELKKQISNDLEYLKNA